MNAPIPLEEVLRAATTRRQAAIGLPACRSMLDRRFPLTPEGAAVLIDRGFRVKMERGAAQHIHYPDEAYSRRGVEITDRKEALAADIVIYLGALDALDVRSMRGGAMLLTLLQAYDTDTDTVRLLLRRHIISLGLELLADDQGRRPFADILHEIDGHAAIVVASSLLADAVHGKGILLGGVAGVVPCEVCILGADMAAVAAARTAMGLGATVRIFDNNVYRLRHAMAHLGTGIIASAMHPRVVESALRTADIVVASDTSPRISIGSDTAAVMKRGVICFDLSPQPGKAFPSLQVVDLELASAADNDGDAPARLCYINAGNTVPRTVAMALSNTFLAMLDDILVCDGVANALKINAGLRAAAFTFLGKCVNRTVARRLGVRPVDINLFLQFS